MKLRAAVSRRPVPHVFGTQHRERASQPFDLTQSFVNVADKVHRSGIPWDDASGDRLREWLKLDRSTFNDAARVAILPIGFCYPGAGENGGDLPPRPACAPLWHERLLTHLPDLQLTLLVGQYAQRHYLAAGRKASLTETVKTFSEYGPRFFPLPHPSWRSPIWMRKHPWFEQIVLPELRKAVDKLI